MTERLAMLFHEEASTIAIPAPPADAVLARGRGLRRTRRTVMVVIGAVAAVVLVGTALTAVATLRGDSEVEPAGLTDDAAYQQLGAWARGDEVHVGNAVAVVPSTTGLQYTSVGAIATSKLQNTATLVTPDGSTHDLTKNGITAGAVSDPASPYVAYASDVTAGSWRLSIVDLESGDIRYTSPTPIRLGEFETPTLTNFSGGVVTYLSADGLVSTDWRTGADVPLPQHGFYSIYTAGGQTYVTGDENGWLVRDRDDEAVLLEVPYGQDGRYDVSSVSPDGAWLSISTRNGMRVYEVATGEHVDLRDDRDVEDYGWTPDGHLIGKRYPSAESEVEVCDPTTGSCIGLGPTVKDPLTLVSGVPGIAKGQ